MERLILLARQGLLLSDLGPKSLQRQTSVHEPGVVLALNDLPFLLRLRPHGSTHDGDKHVGQGDQSLEAAVFVHDEGQIDPAGAEAFKELGGGQTLRDEERRMERRFQLLGAKLPSGHQKGQQVDDLEHTEDVLVESAAADGDERMGYLGKIAMHLLQGISEIDVMNLVTGRHDRTDRLLVQTQHVGHDCPLTGVEDALLGPLGHQDIDLLVRHRRPLLAAWHQAAAG